MKSFTGRFPTSQTTASRLLEFVQVHKALSNYIKPCPAVFVIFPRKSCRRPFSIIATTAFINPPFTMVHFHPWREICLSLPTLTGHQFIYGITLESILCSSYHAPMKIGTSPTLKFDISYRVLQKKTPRSLYFQNGGSTIERLGSLGMCIHDMHTTLHFQGPKHAYPTSGFDFKSAFNV